MTFRLQLTRYLQLCQMRAQLEIKIKIKIKIKYLCRMRSIEVVRLTDAHASDKGLYISRARG